MIILKVHKAEPLNPNDEPTADALIAVVENLVPDEGLSIVELNQKYEQDARQIFEALKNSLPGGTLNRLSQIFANHKISDAFKWDTVKDQTPQ